MLPSSGKICSFVWTRVLIQLCIFCGLYFDCVQIQSFSGHFIFLHLSTLPRSDFPGSQGAKKRYRLVLFRWVRAKFLVFYVFFYGVCKPCNEPETSGDWTHKYHKAALLLITLSLYWTFLYLLYLLSLYVGIFSVICLFWHTLRERDRDANSSLQNEVTWCDFLQGKQVELLLSLSLLRQKT